LSHMPGIARCAAYTKGPGRPLGAARLRRYLTAPANAFRRKTPRPHAHDSHSESEGRLMEGRRCGARNLFWVRVSARPITRRGSFRGPGASHRGPAQQPKHAPKQLGIGVRGDVALPNWHRRRRCARAPGSGILFSDVSVPSSKGHAIALNAPACNGGIGPSCSVLCD